MTKAKQARPIPAQAVVVARPSSWPDDEAPRTADVALIPIHRLTARELIAMARSARLTTPGT